MTGVQTCALPISSVNEDGREPSPAARGASKTRIESTIQKVDDVDLAAIAAEARGGRTTDWRAVTPTPQPIATVEEAPIEALERVISIPKGVTDLRIVLRFE